VSQISPPIRILLVVLVAFVGVYMMFMRPKEEVIPPAEPAPNTQTSEPAVSEPGKVAEAAQNAVDATNESLAKQESVDGVDAGEAAAGTAAGTKSKAESAPKTGEAAAAEAGIDLNGIPKPIARAIRKDKTLVLLFWNGKSADDKAVHEALAKVNRWDGRVYVGSASIKKIAKYGRITRGVDVEQSPTIVVADNQLHAETLVGYVDATTIDQVVVDAFRNTTGLFTDAYLKQVDKVCFHRSNAWAAIPSSGVGLDMKKVDARMNAVSKQFSGFVADFKAVKAPKKWRKFRAASVADLETVSAGFTQVSATLTPNTSFAGFIAAANALETKAHPADKRADKRFNAQNLFRCGSQF
jgi:hypothetical protein